MHTSAYLKRGLSVHLMMSSTTLAVDREIVDLTKPELILSPSRTPKNLKHPSRARALTVSDSIRAPAQHQDHMHGVVALLRPAPPTIDLTGDDETDPDVVVAASPPHRWQNLHRFHSQVSIQDVKQEVSEPSEASSLSTNASTHVSPVRQLNFARVKSGQESKKKPFRPFPFMNFPPEIRNTVYKVLLTIPNAPIEFPGLTGQNAARQRAQWAKCTTTNMRRRHKKIFLEILEVCRYVDCRFLAPILDRKPYGGIA